MLPSLSQLPICAPGPGALERDFAHMYLRRLTDPAQRDLRGAINGRVLDARGNPQHVMDEAERWRRKQLQRMNRRRAAGTHRATTFHMSSIPSVTWQEGVEVLADGALVNVLASTLNVPEADVPAEVARSAVRDATGQSSAELARTVSAISDTDGGRTLGWWGFGRRLREAAPALAVVGTSWIVGALYNLYLLKEEAERSGSSDLAQWQDWNAVTGTLLTTAASAGPREQEKLMH
tara:strand:+ start:6334 stop:7038 length:705 start_codon:yes stop_codon:yes gene_type:complete